jgi:hypothetical protein
MAPPDLALTSDNATHLLLGAMELADETDPNSFKLMIADVFLAAMAHKFGLRQLVRHVDDLNLERLKKAGVHPFWEEA